MNQIDAKNEELWRGFYQFAGAAALLIVLVGITDVVLSMTGGEAKPNNFVDVTEWFTRFQTNRISALSNLGLINIITLSLGIPIYISLHHIHQRINPAFAALAAALFFIGAAVYFSSNTVFSMQALSRQYASASEAQKPLLEAAGRAALAQGADLTPGTFLGLTLSTIGGFIMALVMLGGRLFGKWTAWLGLIGYCCMMVFFPLAAFVPQQFNIAVMISMFGGLSLMAYYILISRKLLRSAKANR